MNVTPDASLELDRLIAARLKEILPPDPPEYVQLVCRLNALFQRMKEDLLAEMEMAIEARIDCAIGKRFEEMRTGSPVRLSSSPARTAGGA